MKLKLFDYHLPKELIAQSPVTPRDHSRLLVYEQKKDKIIHDYFYNLDKYLVTGDVLVFNNTKVFKARLEGKKNTGGKVEVFLLRSLKSKDWQVLIGGKIKLNQEILFNQGLQCVTKKKLEDGVWEIEFNKSSDQVRQLANKIGVTPLPPYIKKPARLKDYQTIYADKVGSVAAPTAGFHFTKRLLARLKKKGVQLEFVTLHVGLGTFQPVKAKDIKNHKMHAEYAEVNAQTINKLWKAKKEGRRIVAVGTTSIRVLETVLPNKKSGSYKGWLNIFIYPGYKYKFVDVMITNFHLPQSTLLMLVAAFIGRIKILKIYKLAVAKKYRFYSFGDGMLLKKL